MKNLSFIVTLVLIWLASGVTAQPNETLFGDSGLRLTGLWGGATIGMTFFPEETVNTGGGFFGAEFNRILLAGIGRERTTQSVASGRKAGESFEIDYKGFYLGLMPQSYKAIHPIFSFTMGGGDLTIDDSREDDPIFVVQPAGGIEVNIFKWWKTSIEGGYRFVSGSDLPEISNEDLSAFFINMKLRFGISWGKR